MGETSGTKERNKSGKKVCVITGGGSGMGLSAARLMGETHYVIICGRTVQKLESAIADLQARGVECEAFPCDVSSRMSVKELARHAAELGEVQAVIHSAGMSPHMGDAEKIMQVNAMGTININEEFCEIMHEGGCILDVSSMSAYMAPEAILPTGAYKYAVSDKDAFYKKMMARVNLFPKKLRSSMAYVTSKNFVVWYAKKCANLYGSKGIRVLSVSPGNFNTPMGEAEKDEAVAYLKYAAIKRLGDPDEIAYLFKVCVDERNSYLTGEDILCDGGIVSGKKIHH